VNVVKKLGLNLKFYRVLENLEIDFDDLEAVAGKAKVLLIIHYFGFPQNMEEILRFCKDREILLIEDCAQALYSRWKGKYLGTFGDYGFFSVRKSLPSPDGGMFFISDKRISLDESGFDYYQKKHSQLFSLFSLLIKYTEFRVGFTPRTFLRRFIGLRKRLLEYDATREVNSVQAISKTSLNLFEITSEEDIVEKRRKNYSYLQEHLQEINNIKFFYLSLPEGVCPLCFPILTDNRDKIRNDLLKQGISVRAFWDILPEEISASDYPISHQVSEKILLLPIHQSLEEEHLDHILCSLGKEAC
jgi:dTDP-4-amino-4,6-dideoxygalactose transaminase